MARPPTPDGSTATRRFVVVVGVLCGALAAAVGFGPGPFGSVVLEVEAENAPRAGALAACWGETPEAMAPLGRGRSLPRPATLEIVATGQRHPASLASEVWLLSLQRPDGSPVPAEELVGDAGWERRGAVWVSWKDQPARLLWRGWSDGPPLVRLWERPLAGAVEVVWQGSRLELDLFHPTEALLTIPAGGGRRAVWRTRVPAEALRDLTLVVHSEGHEVALSSVAVCGRSGRLPLSGPGLPGVVAPAPVGTVAELAFAPPRGTIALISRLPSRLGVLVVAALGALLGYVLSWAVLRAVGVESAARLALVASALIASLSLGELALRVAGPAPGYFIWPPGLRNEFHPAPGVMPGVEGTARFTANSDGLRGEDVPRGTGRRVLVLGGSAAECLYLDDAEAWPHLVQEGLVARGEAAWVGNAGMSGRNSRDHVVQLARLLPQLGSVDTVVVLVGVNDLLSRLARDETFVPLDLRRPAARLGQLERAFSKYPRGGWGRPPYRRTALFRRLDAWLSPPRRLSVVELLHLEDEKGLFYVRNREQRQRATLRPDLPDLGPALEEYRRNLGLLAEIAAAGGVRLVLLTQPVLWRPGLSPTESRLLWCGAVGPSPAREYYAVEALAEGMARYNEVLRAECRERSLVCVDLARDVPADATVFYDDMHFTERGAREVAARVVAALASLP